MTSHTVRCQHHAGRIVRHVETRDHYSRDLGTTSRSRARTNTRDSVLEVVAVGKRLALGQTWTGGLKAELDFALDELERLSTPLTDPRIGGRKLEVEPSPVELDLGQVWDGIEQIERGEREAGVARVVDAVNAARRKRGARDGIARSHRMGDFSKPISNEERNESNRAFWERQAELDATPGGRARDAREENERRLAEQRSAGAASEGLLDGNHVTGGQRMMTPEERNRANADFWAKQTGAAQK